ncbi:unnamed protein product [Paramecium sonneborni]|uniref:Maestro/Maestro-like HEAT-repeats domain-containing protein n=1 Tax=Paramecium sonneborni TaxID=65129 RepID=A0A8S1PVU6_9CILI|nr:unnamed protein product [Paramecium sonneborni]
MSQLLESLIQQFIREGDEKQSEQISRQVMQKHPVVYLCKCSEILDEMTDINNEYIRVLRLTLQVAGLLTRTEDAKLAVIQCTQVLKRIINRILSQPQISEELNQLLTDIHIKLMDIFDELIINHISDFFESGRVPEIVILKIIQQIFESQSKEYFRQFSYEILQKILSSLSLVKTDQCRLDYCSLLQSIYKTLNHFEENQIQINQEQVQNVSWLIFDQIIKDWMQTTTQLQVLSLVGFMSQFISRERLERSLERLTSVYLSVLKQKNNQLRPLFEGFNKFLERLYQLDRIGYEGIIKSIMVSLYEFYKNPIFSPNYPFDPNVLKYKNDLLTLLQTVSKFNIDNCLDLFIGRINSKDSIERVSCLWICNFILSRNFKQISEPYKRQLVLQLLNLQFEQDCEVRYAICEIILQIYYKLKDEEQPINQTYLDVKALLFYLFNQVSIHDKELEEYGKQRVVPFETTLELLKSRAQKILTTLSQDQYFYDLLWPMGLEIINNQKFSPGLSHIFKCYTQILQKLNITTHNSPVAQHVIVVRMLLLIQIPYFFPNLGYEAVNFLPYLIKTFDLKVPSSFHQNTESLKQYLINKRPLDEFYEEKVQQIWKVCLSLFIQNKELSQIEEDFQVQLSMYLNSQALRLPIMKMQATLMSFLTNQETIKYNLDKLFSICHQEYTNQALNLNVSVQEPDFNLRLCVAECFGYIGERHTQLVLDKVKSILNCEVIQKKNTGSFKESVLSIFQKSGSDEYLASFRATLLIAYGCLAKQVSLEILEKNILPNVMPFIGHDQLFNSLQISLESISKAIERSIENTDEAAASSFLLSYQKYRDQVLNHCQKHLTRGNIFRNLNTINLQYRLAPIEYNKAKQLLSQHLESKYDLSIEQVNITFQNCFLLFLGTIKLEEDSQHISVWQSLLYLIKSIKSNDQLIEILQRSIQRVKLKMEQNHKNYFKVILTLLSILYRNTSSKRSVVLILEKVMLSLGVYLDIYQKTDDEFNSQLIKSLREKLHLNELSILMQELQNLISEPIVESLHGFVSLIQCIYQSDYSDLNRVLSLLQSICQQGTGSSSEELINSNLSKAMDLLAQNNLSDSLQILLDNQSEFPVGTFSKLFLNCVSQKKPFMVQSFKFLTDVLNNPEGIITGDIGNYLVNASLFIGQLLIDENKILTEMLPKSMASILGTFLLRFMTCHDPKLSGQSQSVQTAIWAFQNFLNICNIEGISQHVFKKLLIEEEVEDGVQEIVMIYCKGVSFSDQQKLFNFIKGFTNKEQASYRLGAIVVINQFIRSYKKEYAQQNIYENLLKTLLESAEDDSDNVRAQVAIGLGGLSYYLKADETIDKVLLQEIIECLISLLDDQQEICVRSAMISLQNLVDSQTDFVAYIPQLILTTTSNFEKTMTKIRISAFSLFSKLCNTCFVEDIMNEQIMSYIRQALVSVMLHLLDESVQVRQVCKLALESIGNLLQAPHLKQLSNNEIESELEMTHLDENEMIIMIMSINLEQEHLNIYIKSLIEFCKSPEHNIKGAALFSLIILLAFREVGDYRPQIEQLCKENSKAKLITKQLVMKAAYYL